MSQQSSIEWTDATWNPVRGCTKISPGCKNCYAETFAERWRGIKGHPYEQGFDLRLVPEKLAEPLRWKKPRMIFVNSMSDLFHEDVPDEYIIKCFAVMLLSQRHTYQVLTKRADRMWRIMAAPNFGECVYDMAFSLSHDWTCGGLMDCVPETDVLPNVWAGVSVENKKHGLPRIELLRQTPAAVRMLSIEPLLEDLGQLDLDGIGWVIVGGESGHGARPMHPDWPRSIRDQCVSAGVPFFFKQWGEHAPVNFRTCGDSAKFRAADDGHARFVGPMASTDELMERIGKKAAGRLLDGREWNEMPKREKVSA